MTRNTKPQYFFQIAKACAGRSTCLRWHVGVTIVDQWGTIVSTGYNGSASNKTDCIDRGYCWRMENNIEHGSHYEKCFAVHAEANAIMQAGKEARGCSMYLTTYDENWNLVYNLPCMMCIRLMLNAGIYELFVEHPVDGFIQLDVSNLYDIIHEPMMI